MQLSDYYELNLVEGTDTVNPLTIDRPNYVKIDEVMHDNAVSGVGLATELTSGTVHALTRENPETAVFRFVATSESKAGDTYTVDGVQVTALLPSGIPLADGSYVINSNVLCCLTGSLLTFYLTTSDEVASDSEKLGGELPAYYAKSTDLASVSNVANNASNMSLSNQTALGGLRFGIDSNGKYGYYKVGADTVTPFSGSATPKILSITTDTSEVVYTFTEDYESVIVPDKFSGYVASTANLCDEIISAVPYAWGTWQADSIYKGVHAGFQIRFGYSGTHPLYVTQNMDN